MRKTILLLVIIFVSRLLLAQTSIPGGDVSGVWNLAGSPYLIGGNITIQQDMDLTIDPGVTVSFLGSYRLTVNGTLNAIGCQTDSIIFTRNDTTGFYNNGNDNGGWRGMTFPGNLAFTYSSMLAYCKIEFVKYMTVTGAAIDIEYYNKLTIYNSTFSNNKAYRVPCVFVQDYSNVDIEHCLFYDNYATENCGAIYYYFDCKGLINANKFVHNSAYEGGALCLYTLSNNWVKIMNNLFIDNYARHDGGAIYIAPTEQVVILANNTFVGNHADNLGGAIYCAEQSSPSQLPTITNNILWGNLPDEVYKEPASTMEIKYSDIKDGTAQPWFGQGCIDTDPLFEDAANDNFNLSWENFPVVDPSRSPCMNSGNPDTTGLGLPSMDLNGFPRINQDLIDMGAYEFQSIPSILNDLEDIESCSGDSISFNVSFSGYLVEFQWLKNGLPIPGATDTVLILDPVTGSDEANYQCVVANALGSDTTNTALLTVNSPPDTPDKPSGPALLNINSPDTEYSTGEIEGSILFIWDLVPEEAGSISGSSHIAAVDWDDQFTGIATIKVKAQNDCGESDYSPVLEVTIIEPLAPPEAINYQGLLRDNENEILANTNISVLISVVSTDANNGIAYTENHIASTNQFGIFNLEVGQGTPINGIFYDIDWLAESYWLKLDIDPEGNNNYSLSDSVQLASVPYALFAKESYIDNDKQSFTTSGDTLFLSNGGWVRFIDNAPVIPPPGCMAFTDIRDGNYYDVLVYGSQCWMAQNLNFGSMIEGITEQQDNEIPEKYCFVDDEDYCTEYGGLYQWPEAMQYDTLEGVQGICPEGWHIPTKTDFYLLAEYLGGYTIAGGKMKEAGTAHWFFPNYEASNESGFTALPAGHRMVNTGIFTLLLLTTDYWTSTNWDQDRAFSENLDYLSAFLQWKRTDKELGVSVRCIKD